MIRIEDASWLSSAKLEELAADYFNRITKLAGRHSLRVRLDNLLKKKRNDAKKRILRRIIKYLEEIITGRPERLEYHRDYLENTLRLKDDSTLKRELLEVFGYKNLRSNLKGIWLAKSLGIKSCVYCASQSTLTVISKGNRQKLLFDFDHFYPKSHYPYLSVSFFNLIPVCANCNRSKSHITLNIRDHFHPYAGSALDDVCQFSLGNIDVVRHYTEKTDELKLIIRERTGITDEQSLKLANHCIRYSLDTLYLNHLDIAEELTWKAFTYTEEYRDYLAGYIGIGPGQLFSSEEELERYIIGNYTRRKDFLKRPLAKFMTDLALELKLISSIP